MRYSTIRTFALGTIVLIASAAYARPAPQGQFVPIDLDERGPQVGDTIPEFTLEDQYGEMWTDQSIIGPNGTMLVFIRSADW
jgi:hypothetical protein